VPSRLEDLETIFSLFHSAIAYQKNNGYEEWPLFERSLIETEINEKRHWKILCEKDIACVFSVMYNDPVIWKEKDAEPSIYLHRIAINPVYKVMQMMTLIREWALKHGAENGKLYLRMDTWGRNIKLREYYIRCGFEYTGQQFLSPSENEPLHYGGNELSLFQLRIGHEEF
jgi:hypothetical protein